MDGERKMESSLPKPAKPLRVLIAGGGTGGHIYPGIAIAREIRRRHPAAELLFVGTERGLEMKIVPAEGFPLETITISGLKGTGLFKQLKSLLAVPEEFAGCPKDLAAVSAFGRGRRGGAIRRDHRY